MIAFNNETGELIINGDELAKLREQAREWMGESFSTDEGLPAFAARRLFNLEPVRGEAMQPDGDWHTFPEEELATLVFTVAGAATAPLMQDHPNYVFPAERVSEMVLEVMRRFGHDVSKVPGYGPSKPTQIMKSEQTEVSG